MVTASNAEKSSLSQAEVKAEGLQDLLDRMGVTSWDLILVGDGSGSIWGRPCGWACVAIQNDAMARKVFYGAMNEGTVNVAELMAYVTPLTWYLNLIKKLEGKHHAVKNVHILTDSEYVQKTASAAGSVVMAQNTVLWAALALFERQGLRLHWHWIPRESVASNLWADAMSKAARLLVQNTDLCEVVQDATGLTTDECNPS